MKFCIQDPSYPNSQYLHEALLSEIESSVDGAGAYAFASKDGVEMLFGDDSFKEYIKHNQYFLIVGMDDITNPSTLEALKKFRSIYGENFKVKAYIHNSRGSTFHPKYSWFKNGTGGSLVLGSGNLTSQGLRRNREAFNIISLECASFSEVESEWNNWLKHSQPFLFDIDDTVVELRAKQNVANIKAVYEAKKKAGDSSSSGDTSALTEVYKNQPKNQPRPSIKKPNEGTTKPVEKEKEEIPTSSSSQIDTDIYDPDTLYWQITNESQILVAEIPRSGNRWKQANFDKATFENYFGATCGDNGTYRILLKSIAADGILGDTEIRPSVSVSSQNYRFELDAASGLAYPAGSKRPVAIFAKVSQRDFIYQLLMPSDSGYDSVLNLLNNTQAFSAKMRRIQYQCDQVKKTAPELALWSRIDND